MTSTLFIFFNLFDWLLKTKKGYTHLNFMGDCGKIKSSKAQLLCFTTDLILRKFKNYALP
jgi:hypothetical protein